MKPCPGVEVIDVPEPTCGPGHVKIKLQAASVCGTDLHIYNWDKWASERIHPPRIVGHEFCGTIVEVGPPKPGAEAHERTVGQFVSGESHIVCGHCRQCLLGQGHACVNTKILGVDVDGGFADYAVIPAENARPTDETVSPDIACFQDALGNAVHTAFDGPVIGQNLLITGMGPIGLFALSICKAVGATKVIVTEVSEYRSNIARELGADLVLSPLDDQLLNQILNQSPGGVDGTLEMSGHPDALTLAMNATRPGGRISLLGIYKNNQQSLDLNRLIFKGIRMQGIVGRKLWETWDQMHELLISGHLNLAPVVTHRMHFTEVHKAMEMMNEGHSGKVVFYFD